jgi:hypothetical protein
MACSDTDPSADQEIDRAVVLLLRALKEMRTLGLSRGDLGHILIGAGMTLLGTSVSGRTLDVGTVETLVRGLGGRVGRGKLQ